MTVRSLAKSIKDTNEKISNAILNFFVSTFDLIFGTIQRWVGVRGMPYVFVLPNLLIFGIFILFPMLLNFVYAFTGGTEFFPDQRPWVGTANFEQLLTCESFLDPNTCREDLFWRSVFNTAGYVTFQVGLMVLMSLITAVVLNQNIKARGFFRSVYFYPVLLSPIVVALIWRWILQENGLFNGILVALGNDKIPFLVNAQWGRFWVVIISVWAFMGFYTLILLAGLQAIPADLYEAASIDGANNWDTFFRITLPLLMPSMVVVLVLSLIRAVQIFDLVFAFTGGGPGTATLYLVQYIYSKGFASPSRQFGLAAAASLLMASVLIVLTLIQQFLQREEE
ncbi:MAG: sugar ABC transporter permease [Anaerolineae bacterium]|jgi:alpha-1,4-digalacturonate transport system permease protein|nr:sugar ABC transporter permease [Anaerolineae bacterium]MBT5466694.1 sugar ABC transporter permease [Candidatus Neomarinimicrobiota bacterium]MBT3712420.1 sugar ABC transporter permease [Anaerolineae bacterium]MBT4311589.1 sugar ABC transporter permease [Anaerolineae bacterium]MBT4457821.1 sugar ABC transporter permease [Anaerolineae bacterium]